MPAPPVILALAGGSFTFLGVVIVLFFAVVYGFFTISGSAINAHPSNGLDGAPGSAGPSDAAGMGRSTGTTSAGHGVGDTFSSRGTATSRATKRRSQPRDAV
jgi:hypothetical protein